MENNSLDFFKSQNNISDDIWNKSGCDWKILCDIADDFESNNEILSRSAEFFARVIQTFPGVHSVRWRVKDVSHLLEKIVRKKASKEKKYENISVDNYSEIITDLIGIRALHLFKDEYLAIDLSIRKNWTTIETPVIYIREGDIKPTPEFSKRNSFKVKQHPAGYRSVHYVLESSPLKKRVIAELQVRTIFEEGWSEIDHRIRYPNFTNDDSVNSFLAIFNRLAGSADEMGTFVKGLALSLKEYAEETSVIQAELNTVQADRDGAYREMERIASELSRTKDISQADKEKIGNLQREIERSKRSVQVASAGEIVQRKTRADSILGLEADHYETPFSKFLAMTKNNTSLTSLEKRLEIERKKQEDRLSAAMSPADILNSKFKNTETEIDKLKRLLNKKK